MRSKINLFILLLGVTLHSSLNLFGQQKKKVENVKGEWVVSNDITLTQARENAINQAKVEALRVAGVPEFISESNLMFRSEKKEQMKEFFQSMTTIDVSGEIFRVRYC